MMPISPRAIYGPSDNSELINQIKAQDAAWKDLAGAIGDVAYVLMSSSGSPNVAVAERLRDSIVNLMCCGSEKQIKMLETPMVVPQNLTPFVYPASPDMLVNLCSQRDRLQAQIDQIDRAKEAFSDMNIGSTGMGPMGEMIEATMGVGLRQRLDEINQEITTMQKRMESSEPPTETAGEDSGHARGGE